MLIAIGLYLALTLVVGVALSARVKSATDYLIAGRGLGLGLTTASLAAVQIGAALGDARRPYRESSKYLDAEHPKLDRITRITIRDDAVRAPAPREHAARWCCLPK